MKLGFLALATILTANAQMVRHRELSGSGSGSGDSSNVHKFAGGGSGSGSGSGDSSTPFFNKSKNTAKDEPSNCCSDPKPVPTECELDILIQLLDIAVSADQRLSAQWLRLAFHDAGTYNQEVDEGGANGCLLTSEDMAYQEENGFLHIPIQALLRVKDNWESHPDVCVDVSAADVAQFAGYFSSVRQEGTPGLPGWKIRELKLFEWGRPDEKNCKVEWTKNLPGIVLDPEPAEDDFKARCLGAGTEIKTKLIDRNGFTTTEAVALIGAHGIGKTRSSFGETFNSPWVKNGRDRATPKGPIFDNSFFHFLYYTVEETTMEGFKYNTAPFDQIFPNWMRFEQDDINYLDTDIVLKFPSEDKALYPDYHKLAKAYADDNNFFLRNYFGALNKMSKLGVKEPLRFAFECTNTACGGSSELSAKQVTSYVADLGDGTAEGEGYLHDFQLTRKEEIKHETKVVSNKGRFDSSDDGGSNGGGSSD